MKKFFLDITTIDGRFYSDEVESIAFETLSGRIQILPRHISYLSGILPCAIYIRRNGNIRMAALSEGVIEFRENKASILAGTAEWPEDIDAERARKAYDRARDRLESRNGSIDVKRAEMAMMRSMARLKIYDDKREK